MTDQYVSKVGALYIVSVCYDGELGELRSASFGAPAGVIRIVWNLMTVAGEQATFNETPLECASTGACNLINIQRLSPTQCSAILMGNTKVLQPLPYLIRVDLMSTATTLVHDPTIVVSPDPVEIP